MDQSSLQPLKGCPEAASSDEVDGGAGLLLDNGLELEVGETRLATIEALALQSAAGGLLHFLFKLLDGLSHEAFEDISARFGRSDEFHDNTP
jgi:hypothetical protein